MLNKRKLKLTSSISHPKYSLKRTTAKLLESHGAELRRTLFSLRQIFQVSRRRHHNYSASSRSSITSTCCCFCEKPPAFPDLTNSSDLTTKILLKFPPSSSFPFKSTSNLCVCSQYVDHNRTIQIWQQNLSNQMDSSACLRWPSMPIKFIKTTF